MRIKMTSSSAMTLNSVMSVEAGIGCWDLRTGAEQLRYMLCASPPHGLICVGERFLASSQLRESSSSSGSVLALVQAASSCLELSKRTDQSARCEQKRHIDCWRRLVGEYLLVGGKAVTCLAYGISGNDLISGLEDGMVRVWDARTHNILRVFKHANGYLNAI